MRLILLRHGETLWNVEKRLQGHDNSPLSERGLTQTRAIKPYIEALAPKRIVSSDLGRTRQTAEIIGHGDAPSDARLRELDMGAWTGLTKAELLEERFADYTAWRAGTFTPPRGETWDAFRARIGQAVGDWLKKSGGDLLAVVHSGVIRAACHEFLGLPPAKLLPVTPGTLTIFTFNTDNIASAHLEAYNIGGFAPDRLVAD